MASEHRSSAKKDRPESTRSGRLLLLSTDMGMGGGAEEQVIRLAYAFRARGWTVLIVSMLPPSPMPEGFELRGIPLVDLGMQRGIPGPKGLIRLARLVREFKPDVVHSHMVHANLLARVVRLIQPYPSLVCTHHNQTMAGVERDWTVLFELAHRVTDGLAERASAISHSAAEYYVHRRAVPASKIVVVPNGIDSDLFRPDPVARERLRRELGVEDRLVWLAVGRLERSKAYPTLIRAFAKLGERPRTLLVCGQGSLREELESLAEGLGLGDRVRFLGLRGDIPAVMSASDAFALSSDLEGLPLVLLQAAAAGLPIVATDVGGNTEVVETGVNGYVCPSGDAEVFSRKMLRLESLPAAERASFGLAGQARVRNTFEAERVADCWETIYDGLIARAGGRPRRLARVAVASHDKDLAPWKRTLRGSDHAA